MSSDPSVSPDNPQLPSATSSADETDPKPPESAVKFTRTASVWTFLTAGFLILIVLLIFITQNTESGQFAFFGWRWTLPLGVAMLLAAVCGGLITVLAGTARMYQLRRAAKKNLVGGR
ncbi:MAG TPA: lipopolysaccharide assembly protein LapA domain-containing protein [Mycobacterium sp.]